MTTKQPHISNPLDDARRRINDANHNVYRAMHQDTAYEIKQALKRLAMAVSILEDIQREYPIANPDTINTALSPIDPRLCPDKGDEL